MPSEIFWLVRLSPKQNIQHIPYMCSIKKPGFLNRTSLESRTVKKPGFWGVLHKSGIGCKRYSCSNSNQGIIFAILTKLFSSAKHRPKGNSKLSGGVF